MPHPLTNLFLVPYNLMYKWTGTELLGDAVAWWLACSTNDREVGVRVSLAAGCRVAISNRGPVALCTLGLGLLNHSSFNGR